MAKAKTAVAKVGESYIGWRGVAQLPGVTPRPVLQFLRSLLDLPPKLVMSDVSANK